MAFGQYDGSIRIDTSLNTSNFNTALGKITQSVKKLGAAVGISFGIAALVKFGKEAITLASDIEEVQNVVDTAFGSMSGMVEEFASTAIEKLGMSELAAKQTASTYMAMSKGMGMYGEQAAQMAIDATARTGDIASFYNMSQSEADTMLKSIWTGETETLKRIGVVMTQTNLDQYALQKGFGKTTSAMNQQELTMLRYQYVMDKTSLAAGDFEKTQDSWANQTRVLTERWKQFLSIMGTGLIQILTPALKFLNQMMSVLIRFAEAFSKVTAALFGKQTLNAASSTASATEGAASATDDYADSVESAKKEQDKFLAGLDEITTLNEQNSDSASSAANTSISGVSVPALSGEIGSDVTLSPALQSVIDKVTGFFDKLKSIDLEPAKQSLSQLQESLAPFGETVGTGLAWLWDNVLIPLGQWTIEDAVPAFLDLLSSAVSSLDSIITAAEPALQWLWDNILIPFAEFVGDTFIDFLNLLTEAFTRLSDWAKENPTDVQYRFDIILAFLACFIAYKTEKKILDFMSDLKTKCVELAGKLASMGMASLLANVGFALLIASILLIAANWSKMNGIEKTIAILGAIAIAAAAAAAAIGALQSAWSLGIAAAAIVAGTVAIAAAVKSANKNATQELSNIEAPNVKAPTFDIPKLATGAVIPPNAEFAAILGDQKHGRNLEAPESLIRQIVREESGANLTVILQMPNGEEKKVFDTKAITRANRQSGKILIPVEV